MSIAPIILFVFNRPEHTKKTIESLKKNQLIQDSELFVFSDGSRGKIDDENVEAVRRLVDGLGGFRKITIRKRSANFGLANSVIAGMTEVIDRYGKAIVIEDDLLFSHNFLDYMNEALSRYENDPRIFSVGGYSPPLEIPKDYQADSYLSYRCCTWGWGTWKNRWDKVDWNIKDFESFSQNEAMVSLFNRGGEDMFQILKLQMEGKISSWGIRWDYAHFKNEAYCFRPTYSIVGNTGNDGSGVHCGATIKFNVIINAKKDFLFPRPGQLKVNEEINRRFATFYDGKERTFSELAEKNKGAFLVKMKRWLFQQKPLT